MPPPPGGRKIGGGIFPNREMPSVKSYRYNFYVYQDFRSNSEKENYKYGFEEIPKLLDFISNYVILHYVKIHNKDNKES